MTRLGIQPPARFEALGACLEQPAPGVIIKRRIEKNHVEKPRFLPQRRRRLNATRLQPRFTQQRRCLRHRLHQRFLRVPSHAEPRPARQRFQRQRPASGIRLQRRHSGQILSQPVEQRFAHPVGGWPHTRQRRKANHATAMTPADNAQRRLRNPQTCHALPFAVVFLRS